MRIVYLPPDAYFPALASFLEAERACGSACWRPVAKYGGRHEMARVCPHPTAVVTCDGGEEWSFIVSTRTGSEKIAIDPDDVRPWPEPEDLAEVAHAAL